MLKIYFLRKLGKACRSEQGFSMLEAAIALVTLSICLAYAMPLFLYAKINNSKSEIRTGALIVAQRVFDNVRSKSIKDLPINDGKYAAVVGTNPISVPTDAQIAAPSTIPSSEKLLTYAMGRQYQTIVTYCEGLAGIAASVGPPATAAVAGDATICNEQYRKFKVEVKYNGTKVYDLEANYTQFE
jgi:type II secretory pathway pseudopilin PulG